MKADNEPAISLPVYFESVKIENMFFDKKKKKKRKKERKKEKKKNQVSELIKQRYVTLEWFTSLKSRPFILESVTAVNKLKPWKQ